MGKKCTQKKPHTHIQDKNTNPHIFDPSQSAHKNEILWKTLSICGVSFCIVGWDSQAFEEGAWKKCVQERMRGRHARACSLSPRVSLSRASFCLACDCGARHFQASAMQARKPPDLRICRVEETGYILSNSIKNGAFNLPEIVS